MNQYHIYLNVFNLAVMLHLNTNIQML